MWLFTSFTILYHVTLTRIFIFSVQKMGGKEHILLFFGINDYYHSLFTNMFLVTQYMFRKLTFLYHFRVLCICTLSCKVYQGIFWWEAVKVPGNSIFTFTRTQTLHLPLMKYATENYWFSVDRTFSSSFGSPLFGSNKLEH